MADFARGQLLVDLRERRHLSQEEAAHEIGTSAKSLRGWEHGGKIRWENAKRVGEFYEVDPEALVSREQPDANAPLPELVPRPYAEQLDRIEEKLDELLRRTSDDETATEVPDRLPDEQDPSPGAQDADEPETASEAHSRPA